ncbi:MAG: MarR family transcriptional regulator [Candidatus Omnitrophica bacterium]|nr:MarR family transcriptional regulator [Candidatus Omnitrophota bacterium]MCB9719522.1 MarR family transcriptional regulator [Candidatus Omnitrophota bacterium]
MTDKTLKIREFAKNSPCICFNLRKAARAVTQIYDQIFKELDLTASQISILTSMRVIGGMSVSQLSQAMATDRTTITRNLKPLERRGLIEIRIGQDKRSRRISLTAAGDELAGRAGSIFQEFHHKVCGTVGEERLHQLCSDLGCIVEEIQEI